MAILALTVSQDREARVTHYPERGSSFGISWKSIIYKSFHHPRSASAEVIFLQPKVCH